MLCPQCQGELTKTKLGYMCLVCGYAGALTHGHQLAVEAAEKAHPPPAPGAIIKPEQSSSTAIGIPKSELGKSQISEQEAISTAEEVTVAEAMEDKQVAAALEEAVVAEPRQPIAAQSLHSSVTAAPTVPIADASSKVTFLLPHVEQPIAPTVLPLGEAPTGAFNPAIVAAYNPLADQVDTTAPIEHPAPLAAPPAPAKPSRQRRPMRTATLVGVCMVIIALALAAYILPAQAAARALSKKLANAQSFAYTGNLTINAQSFLSVLDSNLNFNGSYSNKAGSQLAFSGLFASRNYTGSFLTTHNQLYAQMTGSDLPFIRYNQGLDTYHILPAVWYNTKLDNSLYKYYCETRPDTKYPSPLVWYQAIRQVKLHPSPLVEYGQKIDGHTTIHLQGDISGQDLGAAWNNINSSLPDDCQWNNLLSDASGMKVHVDAWTSANFDQIELHFNDRDLGTNGVLTLKLNQYNAGTAPTPPAAATDLAGVFGVRAVIQARDYTRRSNIDALNAALKKYYAAKKTLPVSLAKLAPAYIGTIPTDPTTGAVYAYVITKKTYTLSATLEDSGQLYTVTGP